MTELPRRYELRDRLGRGGGGEVWSVHDRITGETLALKLLFLEAGQEELAALVREASALSGLEGLGLPRVVAFGTTRGEERRPYLLRELVVGDSLDAVYERKGANWIKPLVTASEKLTAIHRAGFLHGDLKPANIIVSEGGDATLVDLGLAAPWQDRTMARGLTPKYAAPELTLGKPLSVRAEVYSLGATLLEGIERRGGDLSPSVTLALRAVAERATAAEQTGRYPSVDEFAKALQQASDTVPVTDVTSEAAWPVLGLDRTVASVRATIEGLEAGEWLLLRGARGSGRTTLLRRLCWTLGTEGVEIAVLERPRSGIAVEDSVRLELEGRKVDYVVLDDAEFLLGSDAGEARARSLIKQALADGARAIAVGRSDDLTALTDRAPLTFDVPELDPSEIERLLSSAMPSLPERLVPVLRDRAKGNPGRLRQMAKRLAHRAILTEGDLAQHLGDTSVPMAAPANIDEWLSRIELLVDTGRFADADDLAESPVAFKSDDASTLRLVILRARIAVGRGAAERALEMLTRARPVSEKSSLARQYHVVFARALLRLGSYAEARKTAALAQGPTDATSAEARALEGTALLYTGDEKTGLLALADAEKIAEASGNSRTMAIVQGTIAVAEQRLGNNANARGAYQRSLELAEKANDASTMALSRLNLAGLARAEQEYSQAISHFESAVDLGQRSGTGIAVLGALLGLANLDLYLGRIARARASIDTLRKDRAALAPQQDATLLGLEADLAERSGEPKKARELYERCAAAWDTQGRARDAIEARLERILSLSRDASFPKEKLTSELGVLEKRSDLASLGEHEVLYALVQGLVFGRTGEDARSKDHLDRTVELARKYRLREWEWMALDARARLLAQDGLTALARRDADAALEILEETAAKLPRDLREVFWNDPRREALRTVASRHEPFRNPHATLPQSALPALGRSRTTTLNAMRRDDRLDFLLELTRELAAFKELPHLLGRVTELAVALVEAERGFVVLENEDGGLTVHAAKARSGDETHREFSRSVAEGVIQSGTPIVTTRAKEDVRLKSAASVHALMIQSIACVPIRGTGDGSPIGALYVETRTRRGERFEAELVTLSAFADQAAIAIENARLLAENRAREAALIASNKELEKAKERLSEVLGRRTEQLAATRRDLRDVRSKLERHFGYGGLLGQSPSMRKLFSILERVKDTNVPVLITGESGTGKEVVARTIHDLGPRSRRPFIGVNCGAIPGNLLEGELFGHTKGAFTGADRDRKGLFREAAGGTLLLDEIGEMPSSMQPGLLRVLQESKVRPVGGNEEESVDVRVVAATNRSLPAMVEEGTFRQDLFYRLRVIEVAIPPLRERAEDIPILVDHFLGVFAARYQRPRKSVSRDALRLFEDWPWPGNVRELENVLLNAWLMSDEDELEPRDFELLQSASSLAPPDSGSKVLANASRTPRRASTRAEFKISEKEEILAALAECNWNRAAAAAKLGLPRRTFYRRLKEFKIL